MAIKIYNLKDTPKPEIIVDTFNMGGNWSHQMTGIRLTHVATGIVVECDDTRSAHKNKSIAMNALNNAILSRELQAGDEND